MDPLIVSLAAFLGVTALIGAAAFFLRDFSSSPAEDRLATITGQKTSDQQSPKVVKEEVVREGIEGLSGLVGRLFNRMGNLPLFFEQADCPLKIEAFFGVSLILALVGLLAAWLGHAALPLYPVAAATGGSLPFLWLWWRRRSRFNKFAAQLPDALELIARALRSGHSLGSGLNVVVKEMPPPIATEFEMAYEQQNLGVPIEKALKNMVHRMPNLDLKFFATSVAIQRQSGGDLAEILDKIGHLIRERFKILGQVKALTGEGRISGIVLMALPVVLFFVMYYINPEYVGLLFTDERGRKMIGAAIVLQILGAFVIKKIINIKV